MTEVNRIIVLYGSQTFTAQEIAERIWRSTKILGFKGPVQCLDEYPAASLIKENFAIFVCATTGQGEVPDNMKTFWKFLLRKSLPLNSLSKLKYGVLGLGDSSYSKFNFVGKKLHKRLLQLGATPLIDIGLCDYQHDLGHDAVMGPWLKDYFGKLKNYFPNIQTDNISTTFIPRWKVRLLKNELTSPRMRINIDIYHCKERNNNFMKAVLFSVDSNIRTTSVDHFQDVRLIKFNIKNEIPLNYNPGDVFNIRPRNSKEDIEDLFNILDTHGLDIKPHYRLLIEECHEGMY